MRTTVAAVKSIIDTTIGSGDISAYIISANLIVTEVLESTTLSDGILREIETWFTAHLIAISRERQATREQVGQVKMDYAGQYGEGLKMTSYGQMVLTLDTSGKMASLGKKMVMLKAITTNKY